MSKIITRLLPLLLLFHASNVVAQQPDRRPSLNLGDAVVTGFSGTIAPDLTRPRPANKSAIDLTFINPDGPSARVVGVGRPGYVWDGRLFQAPKTFDVFAKDAGQLFGVALDDQAAPNIYLAATSAFGLHLVGRRRDGLPERRKVGGPGTGWMKGQFGLDLQGDPGSIYKVDGTTGVVTLFTKVMLDGVPNPGPALGNLAYDAAHKQLFVSDLYTGMIHRFAVVDGSEPGPPYNHGVTGRSAANLAPMPFNPGNRPNIANSRFNSESPDTWGFAPPERRVWGLAIQGGRLFYSARNGAATEGPQIWSIGIQQDGSFAADARLELDVAAQPGPYPISDIAFSQQGAMILAQRAPIAGSYDYSALTRPGEPRVLRYWLKDPNDPPSPGRWKPAAEEYAVGFAGNYRNSNGGVALGYGYGQDGTLSAAACEFSLWSTAQNLRNNPALRSQLEPGGPLVVHGLQGSPADMVRSANEPPATSYFIDYDDKFDDARASGHMGSVRILTQPCAGSVAATVSPATSPPYVSGPATSTPGGCVGPNCFPPPAIDVKIGKENTPEGGSGTWFTLWVTNVAAPISFSAGQLIVTDAIPAGMTVTGYAGTGPGWTCTPPTLVGPGTLTCTYNLSGSLATGAQLLSSILVHYTTTGPGPFQNCATVGVSPTVGVDTDPTNNTACVTVTKTPIDLTIKKTVAPSTTILGGYDYTLTVTNLGPAFVGLNFISISDPVPSGVTYTAASGTLWTCPPAQFPVTNPNALNCTYNAGGGLIATNAVLNPLVVTATIAGPGTYKNCATVSIDAASGLSETTLANNTACAEIELKKPPVITPSCGINVIFVVDVSASIQAAGAAGQVQNALNNAKLMFKNLNSSGVPAKGAVITFSTNATVVQPMSAATLITPTTLTFSGQTNWEAGLTAAIPLAAGNQPAIVIFITDGIPNLYLDPAGNVAGGTAVVATNEAMPAVAAIYAAGSPIFGIGIGGVMTNLTALLGSAAVSSSFGGLNGELQTFAKKMCPDLYLTKNISPGSINYHNNPGPHQATITLTLQNSSSSPLTGVQVKDALPPGFSNAVSANPNFSFAGGVVTWNVGNLAPNATVTLTFTVNITPPPLTCNWITIRNFAQVTAVNEPVHSMPNSFPPPGVVGPVVEHDEASAAIFLKDCEDVINPTTPYLQVTKSSVESCHPTGQPAVAGEPLCSFTVQIQAVGNFVGNVVFGDAIIKAPGPPPVSSALSSVTLVPPPAPSTQTYPCVLAFTTTTATCTQNNVVLNNGHIIKFTFTLAAPPILTPGDYKNCFMAAKDTLPPAQKDWPAYYNNTPTSWNWYPWGYCGLFTIPAPIVALVCEPGTSTRQGNACVCSFPSMLKSSQTACSCPADMSFVAGGGCVARVVCNPPLVLNAVGTDCVRPPACTPPLIAGPVPGVCVCPQGTVQQGRECVRPPLACAPPMVPGPVAGQCGCPQGTVLRGRRCVPPIVCRPPQIANPAGTSCVCPAGLVQRGRSCVQPTVCNPPAKLNRRGACECPTDMVARGTTCVPRERRPVITPGDIMRNIPGGGRDNPAGPRGGSQGPADSPGRR